MTSTVRVIALLAVMVAASLLVFVVGAQAGEGWTCTNLLTGLYETDCYAAFDGNNGTQRRFEYTGEAFIIHLPELVKMQRLEIIADHNKGVGNPYPMHTCQVRYFAEGEELGSVRYFSVAGPQDRLWLSVGLTLDEIQIGPCPGTSSGDFVRVKEVIAHYTGSAFVIPYTGRHLGYYLRELGRTSLVQYTIYAVVGLALGSYAVRQLIRLFLITAGQEKHWYGGGGEEGDFD